MMTLSFLACTSQESQCYLSNQPLPSVQWQHREVSRITWGDSLLAHVPFHRELAQIWKNIPEIGIPGARAEKGCSGDVTPTSTKDASTYQLFDLFFKEKTANFNTHSVERHREAVKRIYNDTAVRLLHNFDPAFASIRKYAELYKEFSLRSDSTNFTKALNGYYLNSTFIDPNIQDIQQYISMIEKLIREFSQSPSQHFSTILDLYARYIASVENWIRSFVGSPCNIEGRKAPIDLTTFTKILREQIDLLAQELSASRENSHRIVGGMESKISDITYIAGYYSATLRGYTPARSNVDGPKLYEAFRNLSNETHTIVQGLVDSIAKAHYYFRNAYFFAGTNRQHDGTPWRYPEDHYGEGYITPFDITAKLNTPNNVFLDDFRNFTDSVISDVEQFVNILNNSTLKGAVKSTGMHFDPEGLYMIYGAIAGCVAATGVFSLTVCLHAYKNKRRLAAPPTYYEVAEAGAEVGQCITVAPPYPPNAYI